jgi:hypothetical protein
LNDRELEDVTTQKVDFDILVRTGMSIGLVLVVGAFLNSTDFFPDDHPHVEWAGIAAAVGFVPWLGILDSLWNVRTARGEGLLAKAEDVILVAGMLCMELTMVSWFAFHMHFYGERAYTLLETGLCIPMVLGSLTSIHTAIRLFMHGNGLWRSLMPALFIMLSASCPSLFMLWGAGFLGVSAIVSPLRGWFYAHALSFALAYGAVAILHRARVNAAVCSTVSDDSLEREATKMPLPNDGKTAWRIRIASALCLENLLYPLLGTPESMLPALYYASFIGLLIPWLYWASILSDLVSEMVLVAGDEYSNKVRREWVTVMVWVLTICGAWVSPAAAYYPVEMLIPMLGAIGLMFALAFYIAPNVPEGKVARAAGIMSLGMVLQAVTQCCFVNLGHYLPIFKNPMLVSASLAAGNALVFFGLYQLREAMRFLAIPNAIHSASPLGAVSEDTEERTRQNSGQTDQPDAAGSAMTVPKVQRQP